MTFFGWGKKQLDWIILKGDEKILLYCLYSYFSINFMPIALNATWHLYNPETETFEDVKYKDLQVKFGDKTPKIGWYRRFTLLAVPALAGLLWFILYNLTLTIFPPVNL